MKRVALYCRVSTEEQSAEGISIQAQLAALRSYAEEHNYVVVGEFIDDGISGTLLDERDELQKLLNLVKQDSVDIILFVKLDRWFRSVRHYMNVQSILEEHNVVWKTVWESYETESAVGKLMVTQMLAFAEFEVDNTRLRTKRVFDFKKAKGEVVSGKIPYGFRIEDKHLVIDEEKAKVVREVFDLYLEIGSMCEVIRLTQGQGLPKTQRAFKKLLQNRKYIGEAYGYENWCPAIIDRKTFDLAQKRLAQNVRKNQYRTYIFSGLVYCKDCDKKMTGTTDEYKRTGKRYKLYRCMFHYRPLPTCGNSKQLNEHKLEKYLVQNLEGLAFENIEVEDAADQIDYTKLIAATEKKIARLKDLYVNELIDLAEYKKDVADYQKEIADYKAKLERKDSKAKDEIKKLIGMNLADWYWTLNDDEKRTLWRSVIKEIRFGSDKSIEVNFL